MALQRLTRARFHLMEDLTRESNFLMTNLYLKFSDCPVGPFTNKLGVTSLAVMEEFKSVEELVEMPLDKLVTFWSNMGKIGSTTLKPLPVRYRKPPAPRTVYLNP